MVHPQVVEMSDLAVRAVLAPMAGKPLGEPTLDLTVQKLREVADVGNPRLTMPEILVLEEMLSQAKSFYGAHLADDDDDRRTLLVHLTTASVNVRELRMQSEKLATSLGELINLVEAQGPQMSLEDLDRVGPRRRWWSRGR